MKIVPSSRFEADLVKLAKGRRELSVQVFKKLQILAVNPRHISLRLHKLSGTDNYSVAIDMSIRVLVRFKEDTIYLIRIGKHEDVY